MTSRLSTLRLCAGLAALFLGSAAACDRQNSATDPQEPAKAAAPAKEEPVAAPSEKPADPTPAAAKEPGPAAARTPPGMEGTASLGEACDSQVRCKPDLGCSGLYHNAAGTCIEASKAKEACMAAGHDWGKWGMGAFVYCNRKHPDAGKACKTSADCVGKCIVVDGKAPQCQPHENEFGCYGVIDETGRKTTLCAD
jgi:hypothetical protein